MKKNTKQHIKDQFVRQAGYEPELDNPKTFNEKIQWLKLYYHDPLMTKCADKYAVRDFVSKALGEEYLIPLIGVYENVGEIDFATLPNEFVLKLNSGSGEVIICKNKQLLDIEEVRAKLNEWLKPEANHYYYSYEWSYKNIKNKIICEKFLDTDDLLDYKFMCFSGEAKLVFTCSERSTGIKVDFFDLEWNKLPFIRTYPNSDKTIQKPKNFNKMKDMAEILSREFPFARVDFYEFENRVYFGEITFYPGNGMEGFEPIEWDYKIGELLRLPSYPQIQLNNNLLVSAPFNQLSTITERYKDFTIRIFREFVRRCDLLISVEDCSGYYPLLATTVNDKIKVIIVEPNKEKYKHLCRNLELNKIPPDRINCVNAVESDNIIHFTAKNRKQIIFIRIDANFHALNVLQGLEETLRFHHDITIMMEIKAAKITERDLQETYNWLVQKEFNLFAVDDQKRYFLPLQKNGLRSQVAELCSDTSCFNIICVKKSKTLSLLLFSHTGGLDGAGRSLLDLAKGLISQGTICNVVVPFKGTLQDRFLELGCGVYIVPPEIQASWQWVCSSGNEVLKSGFSASFETVITELLPQIRKFAPDMILSQTIVSPWGAFCAEALNIPHALSAREYGQLDHELTFVFGFKESVDALYRTSDSVFCITNGVMRELFGDDSEKKSDIIYSAIELDVVTEQTISRQNINDYFIGTEGPVICLAGTFQPGKGQKELIEAVISICEIGFLVRCLLVGGVGDKPYFEQINKIIENSSFKSNFACLSFTPAVHELIAQSDIVVSCSRCEALGRTLIEAALLEIPIIYADSGGPKEIFEDGVHGLAYQVGDHQELSKRIMQVLQDPAAASLRARTAKTYCEKRFNAQNYAGVVYERLITKKRTDGCRKCAPTPVMELLQKDYLKSVVNLSLHPKIYWAKESRSFTDEKSKRISRFNYGFFDCSFEIPGGACNYLRFDPVENELVAISFFKVSCFNDQDALISNIQVEVATNGFERDKQWEFFHYYPQIVLKFSIPVKKVSFSGEIRKLSKSSIIGTIASLNQEVAKRDEQIASRDEQIVSKDYEIAQVHDTLAERGAQISLLKNELERVLSSKSWLLTMPLRNFRRNLKLTTAFIHRYLSNTAHLVWRNFPLSSGLKGRIKDEAFRSLPIIFKNTEAYKVWRVFQNSASSPCGQLSDAWRASQRPNDIEEYVPLLHNAPIKNKKVRLIAFYLPQFHPIPENNAWWGEGFTEWTNVQPARIQFKGHYQPRIPGELGYYNLLEPNVQRRQIELAKLYGVDGFCFYFYWFSGKRLLEAPLQNYLKDPSIDFPFCLCWANENWTRRWDGLESEILIAQNYSEKDDLSFIQYVGQYIRDTRYIRVDGKPLLVVYRPSLLPSAKATTERWRRWCRENGIGEIYLAYTQSFDMANPENFDFDAAIEFPPNNSAPPNITANVSPLSGEFNCTIYDWRELVKRSENYNPSSYRLFRGVCPSWDNTARRKNRGTVFLNSTPRLYQKWLENAIGDTLKNTSNPEERLIFINSWNEWAEGAYLEPDACYGYAWLQATRNALLSESYFPDNQRKILLIAHDAHPHGSQMLILNLAKMLNQGMGFYVDLVCLGGGPLIAEYSKWANVHALYGKDACGDEAKVIARKLYQIGHRKALANTTVSGFFLATLVETGIECVALIHELRGVIDQNNLHTHAKKIASHARKVVFPAIEIAESFKGVTPISDEKVVIRPQGLYKRIDKTVSRKSHRLHLRQKFGLAQDNQIVLGVGYADYRKGIDLFVAAGLALAERLPKVRWVWIGHWEQTIQHSIHKQLSKFPEVKDRFIFPGLQKDTELFYGGADVFALTSREDPFPSVALEALDAGLPVVSFEGAGGIDGLIKEGCGKLVPNEDAFAFAATVEDLLKNAEDRDAFGQKGAELIKERFSFREYIYDLLDILGMGLTRVTAIVPNYNYAEYLPERLGSIVQQDYPIYEIIFLDDCSKDASIQVAENVLRESGIDYRIVINKENSGSVFRQWQKGVCCAKGTHIWLAEADDSCGHELITELLKGFRTPGVVLSYCESKQIDGAGRLLADSYQAYVADIDIRHWQTAFVMDGEREIAESLSIKNTIPNVSAVLFEKDTLRTALEKNFDRICSFRIAGDWLIYVLVLKNGKVAFSPLPLNKHRRHSNGVTISNINQSQIEEIRRMQEYIAECFDVPETKSATAKRYIQILQNTHGIAAN